MSGTVTYSFITFSDLPPGSAGILQRSTDGAFIPCDLENMDYQRFLEWLAAGNPAPAGWTGPTNPPAGGTG